MYVYNPFGDRPEDINEVTAADRIGGRIRKIREEQNPKMSQTDLGEKIGLNANRVQQYENGARKPKMDLLKKFAEALGVETLALTDPVPTSYIGVMYTLFEMEQYFDLRPVEIDGHIYLSFGKDSLASDERNINQDIEAWYERRQQRDDELRTAESIEDEKRIIHDYHMWEWTFPQALSYNPYKKLKQKELEEQIKRLQQELENL